MTVVAGFVDKDKTIHMAADSQVTNGVISTMGVDKIFKKNNFLIGATGAFKTFLILKNNFVPPGQPDSAEGTDLDFINSIFMEHLEKCLKDNNGIFDENGDKIRGYSELLVGYRGNLYNIDCTCTATLMYDKYAAVGSGSEFAFGAMYAHLHIYGTRSVEPRNLLKIAVNCAKEKSIRCGGDTIYKKLEYIDNAI